MQCVHNRSGVCRKLSPLIYINFEFPSFSNSWCTNKSVSGYSIWFCALVNWVPLLYFFERSEIGLCTIADEFKQLIGTSYELFLAYWPYSSFPMICVVFTNVSVVKILCQSKKHKELLHKANKDSYDISSGLMVIDCPAFAILPGISGLTISSFIWHMEIYLLPFIFHIICVIK